MSDDVRKPEGKVYQVGDDVYARIHDWPVNPGCPNGQWVQIGGQRGGVILPGHLARKLGQWILANVAGGEDVGGPMPARDADKIGDRHGVH